MTVLVEFLKPQRGIAVAQRLPVPDRMAADLIERGLARIVRDAHFRPDPPGYFPGLPPAIPTTPRTKRFR